MKASDDLFTLIKSLAQSEKRYFKIYASRHVIGEINNYVKLFDALDGQKTYDEDKTKVKFKGEKFVLQLSVTKHYLYNLILKSLNSFQSEKSVASRANESISAAKILYKKALFEQALKVINKVINSTKDYELYLLEFEALNLKQKILFAMLYSENYEKEINNILIEQKSVLSKLNNALKYSELESEIFILDKKDLILRSDSDAKKISKLQSNQLLADESMATTYESRNIYYNLNVVLRNKKGASNNETYDFLKRNIEFLESRPEMLKEDIERYILVLGDSLTVLISMEDFTEFMNTLEKYKKLPELYSNVIDEYTMEDLILYRAIYSEITMYIRMAKFKEGLCITDEIDSFLKRAGEKINVHRRVLLYFRIAQLYFITGNYDDAITSLNKILNNTSPVISHDIQCYSRILNLLIHLELNDFDLLEYSIRSTYRYLSKIKKLYEFEKIILNFIRHSFKFKTDKDFIEALQGLKKELELLLPDRYEKKPVLDLYIIQWIDSKLKNRSFAEIMKDSVKKRTAK